MGQGLGIQLGLGGGRSATASGSPAAGAFSNASSIDITGAYGTSASATNDHLIVPYNSAYNFGTGPFSVSLWFRTDGVNDYPCLISCLSGTLWTDYSGWYILWQGGAVANTAEPILVSTRAFTGGSGNYTNVATSATYPFAAQTWHHVVLRRNGSSPSDIECWVNGAQKATGTEPGSINVTNNTGPIIIGSGYSNDPSASTGTVSQRYNTYAYNGHIDEVSLYDYKLSDANIVDMYNSGTPASVSSLSPVGWWRMGDNNLPASGAVSTVSDASATGNAAGQSTAAWQPVFSATVP